MNARESVKKSDSIKLWNNLAENRKKLYYVSTSNRENNGNAISSNQLSFQVYVHYNGLMFINNLSADQ